MAESEPLLQAFWDEVEVDGGSDTTFACATAEQLQQLYPNQLLQYLKHHGVKKLGSARVPASELQRLGLGPRSRTPMLTRGSNSLNLDWKADWGVTPLPDAGSESGSEGGHGHEGAAARRVLSVSGAGLGAGAGARTEAPAVVVAVPHAATPPAHQHGREQPRHSHEDQEAGPRRGSGEAGSSRGRSLWGQLRALQECGHLAGEASCAHHAAHPPPPPLPPPPTVVLEAYVVAVRDAAAPGERGLLRPVLRRWQLGSCSAGAFGLPAVQAIVNYKWGKFAGALLAKQLAAYGLWLGSFTGFMLLFTSNDAALTDRELLSTWQGRAACVCEALALLGMLPFLLGEVAVLAAYGFRAWLSAWNLLDVATYGLQIAITVLHLGVFHDGPWRLTLAVAVQAVLLAVRLTYFSRVFRSTTFDFMGALQAVAREVGSYLGVLLLLMCGFAAAFYTVFRDDPATEGAFDSLPVALMTCVNYAISGASYYMHNFLSSASPAMAVGLIMVYQVLVSMILMGLLTGIMTNALARAQLQEAVITILNRAQVIDELETVLPIPLLAFTAVRQRGPGAIHTLPYIHVLRVDPRQSREDMDGVDVWPAAAAQLGLTGPGVPTGGGGGSGGDASNGGGDSVRGSSPRSRQHSGALPRPGSAAASLGAAGTERPGGAAAAAAAVATGAAVERLEGQVRALEGQLAEVRGALQQLLELNSRMHAAMTTAGPGPVAAQAQQVDSKKGAGKGK